MTQNVKTAKVFWSARERKRLIKKILLLLLMILLIFLIDLPLISMAGTALKEPKAAMISTSLLPESGAWSVQAFINVFSGTDFGKNLINSIIETVGTTALCCFAASLAGYALSRYRGKVFSFYSTMLLIVQMFPTMLLLIPIFTLYSKMGMMNNLFALVLSYTSQFLAFNVMMIRGFYDTVPRAIEEAAKIDGCSAFSAYLRVVLPISLPGIGAVAIFTFLNSWNEYTFASLMLRDNSVKTLTVGLTQFVAQNTANYSSLMAASTIATLPALFFLIFAQKYLVQGLTAGAVKG